MSNSINYLYTKYLKVKTYEDYDSLYQESDKHLDEVMSDVLKILNMSVSKSTYNRSKVC